MFFNYDIFLLDVASGVARQLTNTKNNEYRPVWSPDGKTIACEGLKRPMTSSETNSEDTHVWPLDVATGERREVGATIDNRQGAPQWSADGTSLYFTVQSRGTVALYRLPAAGGMAERVLPPPDARGNVTSFGVGKDGAVAYALTTPSTPAGLHAARGGGPDTTLTALNDGLKGKTVGEVESLTFRTFDGKEIEAFLTKPAPLDASSKHPLILMIHGGPHGQQGPAFNHRGQVYAARGGAALMVNYRGSTGYRQKVSDLIARDQDGGGAKGGLAAGDAPPPECAR